MKNGIYLTGKVVKNSETFGVNYQVEVNQTISIKITPEALQDISPEQKMDDVMQQFEDNQVEFERIIAKKVSQALASIVICTQDVVK